MPARRRGLSELLAAIIVAFTITSLAVVFAETAGRAADTVRVAGRSVEEGLADVSFPPILSIGLNETKLYLVIYPQRPLELEYIVYVKGGRIRLENVTMTVVNTTRIVVDDNYDCEPASIVLVTKSGVAIPYSPSRDPSVLRAAYAGDWDLLKKTSIDCDLLRAIQGGEGANAGSPAGRINGDYISNDNAYKILDGNPAIPIYEAGDPYTITVLEVHVNGTASGNGVDLDYNVSIAGGPEVGTAHIRLLASSSFPQPATAEEYIGSITGDQGQAVGVYAVASCVQGLCAAGILYSSGKPTLYYGDGYINMTAKMHSGTGTCDLNANSLLAPALMGQISNYKASLNATCLQNALGVYTSFSGEIIDGHYATTGPLILLMSTYEGSVDMDAWIWLTETRILGGNSSKTPLPCSGPIEYRLLTPAVDAGDNLAKVVEALYNYTPPNPMLEIDAGGLVLYREVTASNSVIPLSNASYYIVAPPYQSLPYSTSLLVRYSSHVREDTDYVKIVDYHWNLTGAYSPKPFMAPLPYLILVKCLATGEEYLVAAPPGPTLEISQAGSAYRGLATILAGVEAELDVGGGNASLAYLVAVSGDVDTGMSTAFNVYNATPPPEVALAGGEARIVLNEGLYVLIAFPSTPSYDPGDYQASYVRAY